MSWPVAYTSERRNEVIEAIGADLCAKFPFPDIMPGAGINKWFVRVERVIHRDMHRGGSAVEDFGVTFTFVCETFAIQSPSDRTSDSDSYIDLLLRAEAAVLALGAAQAALRLGPISTEFFRADNGYRAVLRFDSTQDINIAES